MVVLPCWQFEIYLKKKKKKNGEKWGFESKFSHERD